MAEDGNSPAAPEFGDSGAATDAAQSYTCPYGHRGWVFVRYGRELVCGRCGVRIVTFPGVTLG